MGRYTGKKKYDTISKVDRSETIIFMVSKEEKQIIERIADKYGISIAAYCRLVTVGNKQIFKREDVKDVHK